MPDIDYAAACQQYSCCSLDTYTWDLYELSAWKIPYSLHSCTMHAHEQFQDGNYTVFHKKGDIILMVIHMLNHNWFFKNFSLANSMPSVLWCCWLGGRKGIRPVKTKWWGSGVVFCLERDADLHMAQLKPLPLIVSCFSKIQTGFTFLVPAHPGSPGHRAVKRVCVCVCVSLANSLFKVWWGCQ